MNESAEQLVEESPRAGAGSRLAPVRVGEAGESCGIQVRDRLAHLLSHRIRIPQQIALDRHVAVRNAAHCVRKIV